MSSQRDPQSADPKAAVPQESTVVGGGESEDPAPVTKPKGDDGFGLFYRFFFRFQYTMLHVIGPPRLTSSMDPRTRLKTDYERRKALHEQWKASQG